MVHAQTALVPLVNRKGEIVAVSIIDADGADEVLRHRWGALRMKTRIYGRRRVKVEGKWRMAYLHRFVLGLPVGANAGLEGDHINHQTLDNRRCNLRAVTHAQNVQNTSSQRGSSSRYRGVCWNAPRRRWQARVYQGGLLWSGYFKDEEAAGLAAAEARQRLMTHAVD